MDLQRKGVASGRLGDFEEALNYFEHLYNLRQKIYGKDSHRLAPPLINMGIQYKNIGNLDKAVETYKKAESLYIGTFGNDYSELGIVYINLGNVYSLTGDYNKALEYHKNANRVLQNDIVRFNEIFQISKFNIAETQLKLGYNIEAIRFATANLKTIIPTLKPLLYDLIALAYRNEGQFDLSEKYYLLAIKSWIDLYGESNVELIDEYLAYSSFLLSKKDFEKAYNYSSKAQTIVLKFFGEKSTAYSQVQSNFGDYYYLKNIEAQKIEDFRSQRKRNLNLAIQSYQNAIVSLVDSFDIKNPFADPPLKNIISEIQLVDAFKKKALAMEKMGDVFQSEFDNKNAERHFIASLSSLTKATQLIHRLRIGFENEESKLFFAQNQESTFIDAIKISYKLYKQTKDQQYVNLAYEFTERSKASSLLASLKDVKAKEFGGIPDSLLKREDYLKINVANYTAMLFEENHQQEPDSQRINLFNSKIFKLNEEYSRLINFFEKSYPEYYSFKYENKITGISEVQTKLRVRDALVEFIVDEPKSGDEKGELYRFVITKDAVDFSMEIIDHSYEKDIDFLFQFLTSPNYLFTKKKDFVHYSLASFSLYQKLLKPVSGLIKGKDLIIIPDDKLSYIPFDALLSQMPDTSRMDFRNLNYLVRDFAINYSYSTTLLYNFQAKRAKSSKSMIAFSPQYIVNESRTDRESSKMYYFSPLPGAGEEVLKVSDYIQTTSFANFLAQENTFKNKAPDFDILHLAMHTIINDSLPMFSKLVFSKPDNNSTDDGFLNTYEIYNMKLNARLAVLSACETGSGKLQKGEGVMSLARGFIYAGCPSIVMTLWQVEDKSGVNIMGDFYSYLSKGKRKDVALRMAKLKHLESSDPLTAHPHYWLGYVNIGDSEPLYTSNDIYFVIFLFIAILVVFFDWYYRKKKPRKLRG
ncbi:MAG: CHAT domain-containing protein [Bacteroidota bacterium]|nr:CHAT domain-containing protein [Bacteroidota bacterium]